MQLCVSDAHEGLKGAIAKVLGCPWQRCTVHFLRDMLGHCGKAQQPLVAAAIRQIFAAEDAAEARERLAGVAAALEQTAPKVARLLAEAEDELLAFMAFPARALVQAALDQPAGARQPRDRAPLRRGRHLPERRRPRPPRRGLLIEQNDEWLVGRRYLSEESLAGGAGQGGGRRSGRGGERATGGLRQKTIPTTDLHHTSGLDHRCTPVP